MISSRGDSDVRIFDGAGRLVGTVDCVTRERRDASGRVVGIAPNPLAEPQAEFLVRRNEKTSPSVSWQRQTRKTRIKGTNV